MKDTTNFTNHTEPASIENATTEQEIGLLSGLIDGHFISVGYRDFIVHAVNGSAVVTLNGEVLGGRHRLTGGSFSHLIEWLEFKDDEFGSLT